MKLYERVFATLSDAGYFSGLWALLNSIYAYHGDLLKMFVFSYGLSDKQRERLHHHPLAITLIETNKLPFHPAGAWEAKQQIMGFLVKRARCVYLLDCDLVITSNLSDIFDLAAEGKIVSSTDGAGIDFGNEFRSYDPEIVGRTQPHINSGALCLDVQQHWQLVGLWSFASQFGSYSPNAGWPLSLAGHGDQGVLNALCSLLAKTQQFHVLCEEDWCDCTRGCRLKIRNPHSSWRLNVENLVTGRRQRLVHSSGAKWWTDDGRAYQRKYGAKITVFDHFRTLFPESAPETLHSLAQNSTPKFLIGVCSHGENRRARDAIRRTWKSSGPSDASVRFFSGKKEADETDTVQLDCPDGYDALPQKVQAFFRHALEHWEFDFLFKCDDDTYVVVERLRNLLRSPADIIGDHRCAERGWVSGGAGYLMSRETVAVLADSRIPYEGAEDVIFSKIAKVNCYRLRGDSRLRSDSRIRPLVGNEVVSIHCVSPEAMLETHENFLASTLPSRAECDL